MIVTYLLQIDVQKLTDGLAFSFAVEQTVSLASFGFQTAILVKTWQSLFVAALIFDCTSTWRKYSLPCLFTLVSYSLCRETESSKHGEVLLWVEWISVKEIWFSHWPGTPYELPRKKCLWFYQTIGKIAICNDLFSTFCAFNVRQCGCDGGHVQMGCGRKCISVEGSWLHRPIWSVVFGAWLWYGESWTSIQITTNSVTLVRDQATKRLTDFCVNV